MKSKHSQWPVRLAALLLPVLFLTSCSLYGNLTSDTSAQSEEASGASTGNSVLNSVTIETDGQDTAAAAAAGLLALAGAGAALLAAG